MKYGRMLEVLVIICLVLVRLIGGCVSSPPSAENHNETFLDVNLDDATVFAFVVPGSIITDMK